MGTVGTMIGTFGNMNNSLMSIEDYYSKYNYSNKLRKRIDLDGSIFNDAKSSNNLIPANTFKIDYRRYKPKKRNVEKLLLLLKSIKDEFFINKELLNVDSHTYESMYDLLLDENLIRQIKSSKKYINNNYLLTLNGKEKLDKTQYQVLKFIGSIIIK